MVRPPSEIPALSGGFIGLVREVRHDLVGVLDRLNRECGDIGRVPFGPTTLHVLNTPELVAELLVEHHARVRKSRFIRASLKRLVGEGLFTSDGELWRRQRKLMAPIFHPAKIEHFDRVMTDCTERCVRTWADGAEIDVSREMTRITMAVAAQSLFGTDTFEASDEIGEALDVALHWAAGVSMSATLLVQVKLADQLERFGRRFGVTGSPTLGRMVSALETPVVWPSWADRTVIDALAVLDARVADMIEARRSGPARNDLLSRLLHAHDAEDGAMSDRQLRDEVLTLFVAGHETTATALSWVFYLLDGAPEVRERLVAEVDALCGRTPTARDLPRLALATRVFKEALRLYPPVPIYERQTLEPVEIGGYRFETGAYIGVFPWTLHHREKYWPEPNRFDPDRFLPDAEEARARYAWIPFGAGPRICIGNTFALMEGPLVLATLLQRARLERTDQRVIQIDPTAATARPLGGVPMRVSLRAGTIARA